MNSDNEMQLVYDIGAHNGTHTIYYAKKYKVISVECSPNIINRLYHMVKYLPNVTLVTACISSKNDIVPFYVNDGDNEINSCNKDIASRECNATEIFLPSVTLKSLFDKFGVPYYCKIDIEGNDIVALNSLDKDCLPKYISCETECVGKDGYTRENQRYEIINKLKELGYTKFNLVHQFNVDTWSEISPILPEEISEWYNYESIIKYMDETYNEQLSNGDIKKPWYFWYDLFATK